MAAAAPRAAVTAQVEDVGRVARGAQPLADVTPPARVIGPAVQRQDGGPRRGGFVHVVDQQGAVGCSERGHLRLREQSAQQVQARLRGAAADVVAIARKHAREGARGRMHPRREPHRAYGLFRRATSRAGDPGHRDGAVGREQPLRPVSHRPYGFFGDCAVRLETLEAYGAVSEETVRAMADGAQRLFSADCTIAVTGIAGPGGGTPEKPVGTVWLAARVHTTTRALTRVLPGDRDDVRCRAAQAGLDLLRRLLAEP